MFVEIILSTIISIILNLFRKNGEKERTFLKEVHMPNGRKYTIKFKIKAVELVKKTEKPIARIARALGVDPSGLARWIKKYNELKKALDNQKGESELYDN